MKTLKHIAKTVEFLKNINVNSKTRKETKANEELTNTKFGVHSKPNLNTGKNSNSLLSQMYSEENETLFI